MITYSCGHKRDYNPGHNIMAKTICYDCRMSLVGTEIDFIRFGAPPKDGYSYNYQSGRNEIGVSVYLVQNGNIRDTIRGEFSDRTMYVGKGVMVGTGGDDEPLVEIVKCRKATKKQIARLGL